MKHSPELLKVTRFSTAVLLALGSLGLAHHEKTKAEPNRIQMGLVPLPEPIETVPTTTTTTTSTTIVERVVKQRANRGATRPRLATPSIESLPPEFWIDLTNCESGHQLVDNDPNDAFHSYFQWQITPRWNTWRAAGGTGMPEEHSYEEQLVVAKGWASATNPYRQWPVCWPRAMQQLQERQTTA